MSTIVDRSTPRICSLSMNGFRFHRQTSLCSPPSVFLSTATVTAQHTSLVIVPSMPEHSAQSWIDQLHMSTIVDRSTPRICSLSMNRFRFHRHTSLVAPPSVSAQQRIATHTLALSQRQLSLAGFHLSSQLSTLSSQLAAFQLSAFQLLQHLQLLQLQHLATIARLEQQQQSNAIRPPKPNTFDGKHCDAFIYSLDQAEAAVGRRTRGRVLS